MQTSSYIITTDVQYITEPVTGATLLGVVDGVAYWHCAPLTQPQRFLNGAISDGQIVYDRELAIGEPVPEGESVLVVGEQPPFPWEENFTLVYNPAPDTFRWDTFAALHPELTTPDEDGRTPLMPHQWMGEV
jgi:hypothetical protein